MLGHPRRDKAFLFSMDGQVGRPLLAALFAFRLSIAFDSAIGLRRDFASEAPVDADIKPKSTAAVENQEAVRARWPGPLGGSSSGIRQELARHFRPKVEFDFALFQPFRSSFGVVRALELMIARGVTEQIVKRRRHVIRGWRIRNHHALLGIELEPRPQLQTRNALLIDLDQVQALCGNRERHLLRRATVTTRKQRRFAALLGELIGGGHAKRSGSVLRRRDDCLG